MKIDKSDKYSAANRTEHLNYAIRDVLKPAKDLEKNGKKIFYLNIGDPNKFDFSTPAPLTQSLKSVIGNGKSGEYSDAQGSLEFRKSICNKEKSVNGNEIQPDQIVATQGISEGIRFITSSILNAKDEMLVPGPSYPPYISFTKLCFAEPINYRTIEEENWKLDVDDLRKKVSEKTKAILLINPNNPTGTVFCKKEIKSILDLAGEEKILVISDEIYDQLVFDDENFVSTSKISTDVPVIGLNGLSKAYLIPGWRLGYIYFNDPANSDSLSKIKEAVMKQARIRLCVSTPLQNAATNILNNQKEFDPHIEDFKMKLKERRDLTFKRINEIEGLSLILPKAAFYAFPKIELENWENDKEFILDLLNETGILFVPGSGFCNEFGKNHFRMVYLPPVNTLNEVFDLLEDFMKKARK
ncbi:MAG: aminotransferase class I/II-fold pyridoxal phosphate-dependent enzyme [Candidatus Ranarchaeia archaeon]